MDMTYSGKYTLPMTMVNRCKCTKNNQNHQIFPPFYSLFQPTAPSGQDCSCTDAGFSRMVASTASTSFSPRQRQKTENSFCRVKLMAAGWYATETLPPSERL